MKILFDTNVIIDIINERQDFFQSSLKALEHGLACHTSYITTITITDVLYITKKTFSDSTLQKKQTGRFLF